MRLTVRARAGVTGAATVALLLWCVAFGLLSRLVRPAFLPGTYRTAEGKEETYTFPLRRQEDTLTLTVAGTLWVPAISAARYSVVSGCIRELRVNARLVLSDAAGPVCPPDTGVRIDLSGYLRPGGNRLSIRMAGITTNNIFFFHIRPSPTDPLLLAPLLLLLALIGLYGGLLHWLWVRPGHTLGLLSPVFTGGVLLRVLYLAATPYGIRSYDWQGHLQYVQYLAAYHHLPPPGWGWETFQPPLYYALSALWVGLNGVLGRRPPTVLFDLQLGSLALSAVQLGTMLWIGAALLPGRHQRPQLLLYSAVMAVFPGTLFFASRITNEALSLTLLLLALATLLRWWRTDSRRAWAAAAVLLGLGALTKTTALPLAGAAVMLVVLHPRLPARQKAALAGDLSATVTLIAGWFFAWQVGVQGVRSLIPNAVRLGPYTRLPVSWEHVLAFDPLRVLLHPFAYQVGAGPARDFVWEVTFRTALLANMSPAPQVQAYGVLLVLAGLVAVPAVACGLWVAWRRRQLELPLALCLATFLAAQGYLRVRYPYLSSQDFRYIALTVVPLAAFAARAVTARPRWLGTVCEVTLWTFVTLCAGLPVVIFVLS